MTKKLSQVVAIETNQRGATDKEETRIYHLLRKPGLFEGRSRTYTPKDDEGEQLPPEGELVQENALGLLRDYAAAMTPLLDLTATKVYANTGARADVVVDGEVVLGDVPVEYLMWLEKQLQRVGAVFADVPTLDPSAEWHPDSNEGLHVTEPTRTHRSKKVPRNHVKWEPTDKHPAQVEVYYEDVTIGYWDTTRRSGSLPHRDLAMLKGRLTKLTQAVRVAREEANRIDAPEVKVAEPLFGYLLPR